MKTSVPALFKDPNPAHWYSAKPAYYESCWSWTRVKVVPHPSCSPGQASVCYVALGWKTTWSSGPSSRRRQAKKKKQESGWDGLSWSWCLLCEWCKHYCKLREWNLASQSAHGLDSGLIKEKILFVIKLSTTLAPLSAIIAICSFCSTSALRLKIRLLEVSRSFFSFSTLVFLAPLLDARLFLSEALDVDLSMGRLETDPDTDLARLLLDKLLLMSRFTEDEAVSVLFLKLVGSRRSELRRCIWNNKNINK